MQLVKRTLDICLSLLGMLVLAIPMLIIAIVVKCTSPGPVLYLSKRIGRNNCQFLMPKFRTMVSDAPEVATHLLQDPDTYVTPVGRVLRRLSLDELPQLYNIFIGDMSIIGPRPALYNQDDLIRLRTEKGVHTLTPGLTGWAQINGRDELSIPQKVELDEYYLRHRSTELETKIFFRTFARVIRSDGITH